VESFYVEFGQRLGEARERAGLTQGALARRVGLSRTSVVNIEKGRQRVLLHQLSRFSDVLSVDPSVLLPKQFPAGDEDEWVERILGHTEAS